MNYEPFFRLCFEQSENIFILLSDKLEVIDLNPRAQLLMGWNKKEVCHQCIHDLFKRESFKPFITKTYPPKLNSKQSQIKHKNTSYQIKWTLSRINNTEQPPVIMLSGKVSESLKNKFEADQLDNIVKFAPGLFYWKDIHSVYQGCNDEFARMAGLNSREEVVGKTDFDLIWKKGARKYVKGDQKVIKTGKPNLNIEEVVETADKKLTMISNKVPFLDSKNRVVGIMGITTDITHQKEIEHELKIAKHAAEAASLAKSQFIANVSHDIRTPLSGIVGISKFLEEVAKTNEEKKLAHWVNESGHQLLNLLNDILDVVSLQNVDETKINDSTFDLWNFIQEIVELERPTTVMKKLNFESYIDPDIPKYVVTDRIKLHRILLNLLGNAIKFTEKGSIQIGLKRLEKASKYVYIQFSIRDTGIGIPKEAQAKVFDRFYKVKASYQAKHKGHGLGLTIAQTYVELLGGHLNLESEEGKGTTFYFSLRVKIGKAEHAKTHVRYETLPLLNNPLFPEVEKLSETSEQKSGPRVLIVEDNPAARFIAHKIATEAGCQTKATETAEEAIELLQEEEFDLVLTDLGLPGRSGTELAQLIRNQERLSNGPHLPIVALSAHNSKSIQQSCLDAGMDHVLTKPLNSSKMEALLNHFHFQEKADSALLSKSEEKPDALSLNDLTIFDEEKALATYNNNRTTLIKLVKMMFSEQLPEDQQKLKLAYLQKDWSGLASLAHKIKAGALYCGLVRLQKTCENLENQVHARHTEKYDECYQLLLSAIDKTSQRLDDWLKSQKELS